LNEPDNTIKPSVGRCDLVTRVLNRYPHITFDNIIPLYAIHMSELRKEICILILCKNAMDYWKIMENWYLLFLLIFFFNLQYTSSLLNKMLTSGSMHRRPEVCTGDRKYVQATGSMYKRQEV
jgi:hypothetical protein